MGTAKLLKKDVFGEVLLAVNDDERVILRNTREAAAWARPLARRLLAREARALAVLGGMPGVPELLSSSRQQLQRRFLDGQPMQEVRPADPGYFKAAARLLQKIHRRGVAHNDLAKEPNWLVTGNGEAALVDFQLASVRPGRGWIFRQMAHEDLRHLLKHKRTYCPEKLTQREKKILDNPTVASRIWRATGKPIYLFITRRVLGWQDREGTHERNRAA